MAHPSFADTSGGPAFPTPDFYDEKQIGVTSGMTLRDYFAARAMQTMVDPFSVTDYFPEAARRAYEVADAMLKERRTR